MRRVLVLLAVAALGACVVPARAAETGVIVTVGADYVPGDSQYGLPNGAGSVPSPTDTLHHVRGNDLRYANLDLDTHTVTSTGLSGTRRLFDTPAVQFGDTALVAGVAGLAVGRYPFFCALHPEMRGVLVVVSP